MTGPSVLVLWPMTEQVAGGLSHALHTVAVISHTEHDLSNLTIPKLILFPQTATDVKESY